jgi:DNA-binding transcriptional regulator/RsmH inhibitor MraZ
MEEQKLNEEQEQALRKTDVMRSCVHCGNTEHFETWTELEYNDGSAEPHTSGNYLVNVEYVKCLDCGEVL